MVGGGIVAGMITATISSRVGLYLTSQALGGLIIGIWLEDGRWSCLAMVGMSGVFSLI